MSESTAIAHDPTGEIPPDVYHRRWGILGVLCTSLIIIVIGNTSLTLISHENSGGGVGVIVSG